MSETEGDKKDTASGGGSSQQDCIKIMAEHCHKMTSVMLECQKQLTQQQEQVKQMLGKERLYMKPDKFSGENQNFSDFLIHFETVSSINGWDTPVKKLNMLVCSLTGSALEFLSGHNWKKETYSNVTDWLKNRFDKNNLESVSRSKFESYKKSKNRTWPEVLQDLKNFATKAFKDYGTQALNDTLCNKLMDLLTDSTLRKQLAWLGLKDPSQLCEKIMVWEAVCQKDEKLESKPKEKSHKSDQSAKLEEKVEKLETAFDNLQVNFLKTEQGNQKVHVGQTQSQTKGSSKRRCYACGNLGHIQVCCPYMNVCRTPVRPTYAARPRQSRPPQMHNSFASPTFPTPAYQGYRYSNPHVWSHPNNNYQ